jgi:hypothetical protein
MPHPTDHSIKGNIYFLSRLPAYETIKPYTLRYSSDDGFPQTNVERELHSVNFQDMREAPHLSYDKCGFKVANLENCLAYEDYDDPHKVESLHQPMVSDCVKNALGASSVRILEYVVV